MPLPWPVASLELDRRQDTYTSASNVRTDECGLS
jgi:hypothetical protein